MQKRGKSQKHECLCPLRLYVDQLSLGLSISLLFRDPLLVLVQVLFLFQSPGRGVHPLSASPVLWAGIFPLVSSPRAWPVQSYSAPSSSLLAVAFSLLGLRGIPACSGLRGSGCSHYLARLTHMRSTSGKRCDEPFTHLCFVCLLLSKFQNSECFKN